MKLKRIGYELFSYLPPPVLSGSGSKGIISGGLRRRPINLRHPWHLLVVQNVMLNLFQHLFKKSLPLRSTAARRLAQNAPLEHFVVLQPSLPKFGMTVPFRDDASQFKLKRLYKYFLIASSSSEYSVNAGYCG